MKIAFHGAAQNVTGSKHLLTLNSGIKILLDCGMFQGMGQETDELNEEFGFDACIGGARRDEEKARAKERFFSVRDEFGQWDPKLQRPELWNIYNGKIHKGENVRVFPISNWTELDVWNYILRENIELPSIYFTHKRTCVLTEHEQLMATNEFITLNNINA